jgi:hypothetical protein
VVLRARGATRALSRSARSGTGPFATRSPSSNAACCAWLRSSAATTCSKAS